MAQTSQVTSIAVGVSAAPALIGLASTTRQFRLAYPNVLIRIVPGNFPSVLHELQAGTLDLSIGPRSQNPMGEEFVVETLMKNTRKVVCRLGHPLEKATSLSQLLQADWIITGATGAAQLDFSRYFRQHFLEAPIAAVQCEYSTGLFALLANTDMLAMLPTQWANSKLSRGFLCAIPIQEIIRDTEICATYRAGVPLTPAARHFLTLMTREFEYYVAGSTDG
ncbi:LysR substrate-binding domain-containing protein [Achromobacter insolitus]|uniref:LysR substrate-binding domain-containing protein n=1 Tax=Achromobacter insolitus TaxID=217204 RepID=UPI002FDD0CC8